MNKKEKTFVIIKPDGVQRGLIGEIIHRLERTGLKMVALKQIVITDEKLLWDHYNKNDQWFLEKGERYIKDLEAAGKKIGEEAIEYGKDIVRALAKFMMSGPVVAMILEGNEAVAITKKIVGKTEPATSDIGTIRGDLTVDSYSIAAADDRAVRNLIHCSDSVGEAEREIKLWFKDEEIIKYRLVQEAILYDVNLDGILE